MTRRSRPSEKRKRPQADRGEGEILESVERGEWRSTKPSTAVQKRYARYSKATLRKDRRVNIRISSKDLETIQKRATKEGVSYQTLISSLLHRFAIGQLRER
jgi:predicted DNA binding CopG/RHH family protein